MKLSVLVIACLAFSTVALAAAPVASACPAPDDPCDPEPICTGGLVACLKQILTRVPRPV